jgi:hypothetical protein
MSALNESARLCRDPSATDAMLAEAARPFKDQVRPLVAAGDESFIVIDWSTSLGVVEGWSAEEAGPAGGTLRER